MPLVSLGRCAGEASVKQSIGACHVMRDKYTRNVEVEMEEQDGHSLGLVLPQTLRWSRRRLPSVKS